MPIHDAKLKKFTKTNVGKAPRKHGVYALYQKGTVIYIGRASQEGVTIRGMLRRHLEGRQGPATAAATHYKREPSQRAKARTRELLKEHVTAHAKLPRCNVS
jgi:hypothetical protein